MADFKEYKEILEHTLKHVPDATRIRIKLGNFDTFELDVERAGVLFDNFPGSEKGFGGRIPEPGNPKVVIETPDSEEKYYYKDRNEFVKAELVGVFYTSPSPDAPPFVTEGQAVKKGDVICIIEAMKMMNEIECPYDGTVAVVLAENGSMVEYGQPLFEIRL